MTLKTSQPSYSTALYRMRLGLSASGALGQNLGHQATFVINALRWMPRAVRRYPAETARLVRDVTWGNGSLVTGGGTVGVVLLLSAFAGITLGIEGLSALRLLGMSPLTGIVSAFGSTRELAPLIAAIAFAAQAGCRFTAQLGAMRVSEEIDALEVQAVPPIPYLVSTRLFAAIVAIIPLYCVGLGLCYLSSRAVYLLQGGGVSVGTFDHYFTMFLSPMDVVYSVVKALVFVIIATLLQCYYGFYASGGPQGVGVAAGRAIRASIVVVVIVNTLLTMAMWGTDPGVRISG
ncbi:ABC transporter permease [Gordonia sp. CPCC 205333]|uniref:ABC transporter permease n=1 Tax=Gordonia sp. CPCC 205333 TaxID=3140790 RepID=UPI003AF3801E